jgi:hypothetical protein
VRYEPCLKCGELLNPDARSCVCGWVPPRKAAPTTDDKGQPRHTTPQRCSWVDSRGQCQHYPIMAPGNGSWYCRQHAYALQGWSGMEGKRGNDLPTPDPVSREVLAKQGRYRKAPADLPNVLNVEV